MATTPGRRREIHRTAASGSPGFLRTLLVRPWVFLWVNRLLAPGADRRVGEAVSAELGDSRGGIHLDAGCGPVSRLARFHAGSVGLDVSLRSVRALSRSGQRGVVGRAEALPFRSGCFAAAWSFGLFHHLSAAAARSALAEALRVAAGGKVVLFDGVLPRHAVRRPLAWIIRRLDRGSFMRDETTLRVLLGSALGSDDRETLSRRRDPPDGAKRWRIRRMTYTWTGLEGLWCVLE